MRRALGPVIAARRMVTSTSILRISLQPGSTPSVRSGHNLRVRARVSSGTGYLKMALYEGGVNRTGTLVTPNLTGSLADYIVTIPDSAAAAIGSYANLEVRIWGFSITGQATFEIDQVWMESPSGTVITGNLFRDHDPSSLALAPWQNIEMGQLSGSSQGFSVASNPTGILSPAIVRITDDPKGEQGKVYELTVTPQALANNSTANRCDLYQGNGVAWYGQGKETWEHWKVMFPSGALGGSGTYKPTPGNFNWIFQHHNNIQPGPGTGIVMGLNSSVSGLPANQLFCRVTGGDVNNPPATTTVNLGSVTGQGLLFDHWYDIQWHIIWSTGNDGLCQWYVDGTKIMDVSRPTLLWNASTGLFDQPNYEYSNYRLYNNTINWDSTIYFGRLKEGDTQAIVAY